MMFVILKCIQLSRKYLKLVLLRSKLLLKR